MSFPKLLLVGAVTTLLLLSVEANAADRVALIIGNASYTHAPALATPLNDSQDIGAALGRLGFEVTQLENADQAGLRRGLQAFAPAAAASEVVVVFYSGHAIAVDGRNFLIPVDARLASEWDVEFESVPLDLVAQSLARAPGVRLVMLDASRENPFAASLQGAGATRAIGRSLTPVEPPGETLVAYAAKEGTVTADGEGRNSRYSAALLRYLEEPGLEVGVMFNRVREMVLATTEGHQEPTVYGSLSHQGTYLAGQPAPDTLPNTETASTQGEPEPDEGAEARLAAELLKSERSFWGSIEHSDDAMDFLAYKEQFPGGTFEKLADNRLERLLEGAFAEPQDWDTPAALEEDTSPATSATLLSPEDTEAALGLERSERRRIQAGLATLGFDPGPADGLFGQKTRGAIERWQASHGGEPTGHLDAEGTKALLTAVEAVRSRDSAGRPEERTINEARQAARETIARAETSAARIENPYDRSGAFLDIAKAQAAAGDAGAAAKSIAKALAAAERIQDADKRIYNLRHISEAQAAAGDAGAAAKSIAKALAAVERIEDASNRISTLITIAKKQADAGDADGAARALAKALSAAERIEDAHKRSHELRFIAKAQANVGDADGVARAFGKALPAINEIHTRSNRIPIFTGFAEAQASVGDIGAANETIAKALAVINKGDTPVSLAEGFGSIAVAQIAAGDFRRAAKSIANALTAAEITSFEDPGSRLLGHAFIQIAEAQAAAGDPRGAAKSAAKALAAAEKSELRIDYAIEGIVKKMLATGEKGGFWKEALATAERIEDSYYRNSVFKEIALKQATAGRYQEALATAQRIDRRSTRNETFSVIAQEQATAGRYQDALATTERFLADDAANSAKTLAAIAKAKATDNSVPVEPVPGSESGATQTAQADSGTNDSSGISASPPESSGGCMALSRQHEADVEIIDEALTDHANQPFSGVCIPLIVGRNIMLNTADVFRQCPEGDPTGEQLAALESQAELYAQNAESICSVDFDVRKRFSQQEMLELLRAK